MKKIHQFGIRLNNTKKIRGYTNETLGKQIGVTRNTIQRYISSAPEDVPADKIDRLVAVLKINKRWLITGEGEMDDVPQPDSLGWDIRRAFAKRQEEIFDLIFDEITDLKQRVLYLETEMGNLHQHDTVN